MAAEPVKSKGAVSPKKQVLKIKASKVTRVDSESPPDAKNGVPAEPAKQEEGGDDLNNRAAPD